MASRDHHDQPENESAVDQLEQAALRQLDEDGAALVETQNLIGVGDFECHLLAMRLRDKGYDVRVEGARVHASRRRG